MEAKIVKTRQYAYLIGMPVSVVLNGEQFP